MTSVPLEDDIDHLEQLLLNDQTLIRLARIVARLIQDKAKFSANIAGVTVPHDGNKTNCVFVKYEDDKHLLGQSPRAEAALLATTKVLHHSVDLSSQLPAFLSERKRTPETRSAITATITRYLSVCEAAGFPPDSRQAAAAFKKELLASGVTSRTVNFHLMRVSAFLKWAECHGYVASDPAKGVKMYVDEDDVTERTPYTHEEVQAFIDRLDLSDHKNWLPALLIATGARLNEIAQLTCRNVGVEKGIVFIDINREDGKLVKNKGSIRKVPIVDALAEQLMEHVATLIGADQDYLFPFWRAARPGRTAGRWGRAWLGGEAHRLRHSVATELRNSGVVETIVAEILGHSFGSALSFGVYAGNSPLSTLKAALERLPYRWPGDCACA